MTDKSVNKTGMKTKHFILAVLFAALSPALFAQVGKQDFRQKKTPSDRHQQNLNTIHEFNRIVKGDLDLFDKSHNLHSGQNAFVQEGKSRKNSQNNNDVLYVCDSALTYDTSGKITKTLYTHDVTGQLIIEISQVWDLEYAAVWVNKTKFIYTYNSLGNILTRQMQYWNSGIEDWLNESKATYRYDTEGNMLSRLSQSWDTGIDEWINVINTIYTYDASGNMLSNIYQNWDAGNGIWVSLSLNSSTYDVLGNILVSIIQYWDTGIDGWVNDTKINYTYNASENWLSEIYQEWNTGNSDWVNTARNYITYDSSVNTLTQQLQYWSTEMCDWRNTYKFIFIYDVSGNFLASIDQSWDNEIYDWVNSQQYCYTYDASKNMLSQLFQLWNSGIDSWENLWNCNYTYDISGNKLLDFYQYWDSAGWSKDRKTEYEYDYISQKITGIHYEWTDAWIPSQPVSQSVNIFIFNNLLVSTNAYKAEAWYSSYSLGIKDKDIQSKDSTSFCSPNPAKDLVIVTNSQKKEAVLKIYNMNGQMMNEKLLSTGRNQVSVQNFTPGIYLFVLQSQSSRIPNKVVVY